MSKWVSSVVEHPHLLWVQQLLGHRAKSKTNSAAMEVPHVVVLQGREGSGSWIQQGGQDSTVRPGVAPPIQLECGHTRVNLTKHNNGIKTDVDTVFHPSADIGSKYLLTSEQRELWRTTAPGRTTTRPDIKGCCHCLSRLSVRCAGRRPRQIPTIEAIRPRTF